jgi:hypothetical protein
LKENYIGAEVAQEQQVSISAAIEKELDNGGLIYTLSIKLSFIYAAVGIPKCCK